MVNETMSTAEKLAEALERIESNFRLLLSGKPVRDVSETLAEVESALAEYRAQPAADGAQRVERMSEEQIDALWIEHGIGEDDPGVFARAVETHLSAAWGVKLDGEV